MPSDRYLHRTGDRRAQPVHLPGFSLSSNRTTGRVIWHFRCLGMPDDKNGPESFRLQPALETSLYDTPGKIRTYGLLLRRQALYPLSYRRALRINIADYPPPVNPPGRLPRAAC